MRYYEIHIPGQKEPTIVTDLCNLQKLPKGTTINTVVTAMPLPVCPVCSKEMVRIHNGYTWEGKPTYIFRCSAIGGAGGAPTAGAPFGDHWIEIPDGPRPWHLEIHKIPGAFLAYIEKHGGAPVTGSKPPEEPFVFQMRLFR